MILALLPSALQYQLTALLFVCVLFVLFLLFVVVVSGEPNGTKSDGWSTANKFKSLSNFIAGRPKVALLFRFFGDFRYGALLFMVILVIYKYKNR